MNMRAQLQLMFLIVLSILSSGCKSAVEDTIAVRAVDADRHDVEIAWAIVHYGSASGSCCEFRDGDRVSLSAESVRDSSYTLVEIGDSNGRRGYTVVPDSESRAIIEIKLIQTEILTVELRGFGHTREFSAMLSGDIAPLPENLTPIQAIPISFAGEPPFFASERAEVDNGLEGERRFLARCGLGSGFLRGQFRSERGVLYDLTSPVIIQNGFATNLIIVDGVGCRMEFTPNQ